MYKIYITHMEPNPNYGEEMKEYQKPSYGYNENRPIPQAYFERKALEVELTDNEFQLFKRAAVEIM